MIEINIGTNDLLKFTQKLEKMRKSDLPIVVRQTLNSAAFNMHSKSLPKSYKQEKFARRSPGFLKSRKSVQKADGWKIENMVSVAGIKKPSSTKTKTDQATEDLGIQDRGGKITGRSFIPKKGARKRGWRSPVLEENRIDAVLDSGRVLDPFRYPLNYGGNLGN